MRERKERTRLGSHLYPGVQRVSSFLVQISLLEKERTKYKFEILLTKKKTDGKGKHWNHNWCQSRKVLSRMHWSSGEKDLERSWTQSELSCMFALWEQFYSRVSLRCVFCARVVAVAERQRYKKSKCNCKKVSNCTEMYSNVQVPLQADWGGSESEKNLP